MNTVAAPLVSVVMPVFNGSNYMREGINSILAQTYQNLELILVDDCSIDDTLAIMKSYQDPRIRIIRNTVNLGASATRARGIQESYGKYIALMDHDDISVSERLTKQVAFMENHPNIGVCSSWIQDFGEGPGTVAKYETEPDAVKCHLLFYCLINNSSAMIRRTVITPEALRQSSQYPDAGDYALWLELANLTSITILPEVLLYYRVHPEQISSSRWKTQLEDTMKIHEIHLRSLGIKPSELELQIHLRLMLGFLPHKSLRSAVDKWLLKLETANDLMKQYPEPAFTQLLARFKTHVCKYYENDQ